MKKLTILCAVLLVSLTGLAAPAQAYLGYDDSYPGQYLPVAPEFTIIYEEVHNGPPEIYEEYTLERSRGWDFGDREGYGCLFFEYQESGTIKMIVEVEQRQGYEVFLPPDRIARLNDQGGAENNDGPSSPPFPNPIPSMYQPNGSAKGGFDVCGDPGGQGTWDYGTEDHFPHLVIGHAPHAVTVYKNDAEHEITTTDLNDLVILNGECEINYWAPGDEASELVLWRDLDGPQFAHEGGDPLECGGGEDEPFAIARLLFKYLASDFGVCIHDEDAPGEHVCSGNTP